VARHNDRGGGGEVGVGVVRGAALVITSGKKEVGGNGGLTVGGGSEGWVAS
jgi:hypothetical protein